MIEPERGRRSMRSVRSKRPSVPVVIVARTCEPVLSDTGRPLSAAPVAWWAIRPRTRMRSVPAAVARVVMRTSCAA
jgi:hypothetical protein